MKFKIVATKAFEKSLKKLTLTEQMQVATKLKILQINPHHPSAEGYKFYLHISGRLFMEGI